MKKRILFAGLAVCTAALQSSAQTVVWQEDFESTTNGATSGNNQTLYNTVVQTANTASSIVTTPPAEFTLASGTNCILLSTGANAYTSVRPSSIIGGFTANAADSYAFSFDIYIPSALAKAVGDVNPRLEASGTAGNGITLDSATQTGPGQFHIEYTGSCADIINGNPPANTIYPFIGIDQNSVVVSNYMYMDNIHFAIIPYVPPVTVVTGDFIDTGFIAAEGYSDGDLAGQTNWVQVSGSAPYAFSVINSASTGEADTATAGNHSTNTGNAVYWSDATYNNPADAWEGYVDFKLTTYETAGTNVALLNNQDVLVFGVASETTNALHLNTIDSQALMSVKVRANGKLAAQFADENNDQNDTRLAVLLPGTESGWDPLNGDYETDTIRYSWKIRKTTEFGTYQATASFSNLTTGAAYSSQVTATSSLKTKAALYNSPLVNFTMGHYYKAQMVDKELIDVELGALSVTHSTNNVSAPVAPSGIVAVGTDRTVTLTWDPTLEATSYDVFMAESTNVAPVLLTSGITDESYSDAPRYNGVTNWYSVQANYSTGSAVSEPVPGVPVASKSIIDMDGTRNDWLSSTSNTFYMSQTGLATNGTLVYLNRMGATPMIEKGEVSGSVTYNGYTFYGLTQLPETNSFRNYQIGNDANAGQRFIMGAGWDANSPQQLAYIEIDDMDWDGPVPANIDATSAAASMYLAVRSYSDGVNTAYVYPAIRNGTQWYVGAAGIKIAGIKSGFGEYTAADVMTETWRQLTPQPDVLMAAGVTLADNSVLTNITAMGWFGNKIAYLGLSEFKVSIEGETPSTDYWMNQYATVNNLTDDTDGDGLSNIKEYAFGGNPEVADEFENGTGLPQYTMGELNGTNGFLVVSVELKDPAPGIDYSLEASSDLVYGSWGTDAGMIYLGERNIDYYYKAVSNFIPTDVAAKFIDLKVTEQ